MCVHFREGWFADELFLFLFMVVVVCGSVGLEVIISDTLHQSIIRSLITKMESFFHFLLFFFVFLILKEASGKRATQATFGNYCNLLLIILDG